MSTEPCGGTCHCEPLHQRVREMARQLDALRDLYWREVRRQTTSPAAEVAENRKV